MAVISVWWIPVMAVPTVICLIIIGVLLRRLNRSNQLDGALIVNEDQADDLGGVYLQISSDPKEFENGKEVRLRVSRVKPASGRK